MNKVGTVVISILWVITIGAMYIRGWHDGKDELIKQYNKDGIQTRMEYMCQKEEEFNCDIQYTSGHTFAWKLINIHGKDGIQRQYIFPVK